MLDTVTLKLIELWAKPIWLLRWLKRNKAAKMMLVAIISVAFLINHFLGTDALLMILQMVLQMAYGFGFMILQFVGLFWFLAKPKTITVIPGDKGLITWKDYWGNETIVETVKQWTSLLSDRKKFFAMGGEMIKGLLYEGAPGTGKTYLAMAQAGSGGVAFHSIDGSGFQAMFFGVGMLRVMSYCAKCRALAQEHGGCIAYIDELDALGARSGMGGMGGAGAGMMGMGAGMGIVARLLTEMSGIEKVPLKIEVLNDLRKWFGFDPIDLGVVLFVGATNRADAIDPALRRSGRFSKTIHFDLPDAGDREAVISGYLQRIERSPQIDLSILVQDTAGRSQADIKTAIQEDAVRLAFFRGKDKVEQIDILDALQEMSMGLINPISNMDPVQKEQVAYHEAGHAVALYHLLQEQIISRVSIVRRGSALGYVAPVEKIDLYAMPMDRAERQIAMAIAGDMAVEITLGKRWFGAGSDNAFVRRILVNLAMHGFFGTFELGLSSEGNLGPETQKRIDKYMEAMYASVKAFLVVHKAEVQAVASALLDKEDLTGTEATAVIEHAIVDPDMLRQHPGL